MYFSYLFFHSSIFLYSSLVWNYTLFIWKCDRYKFQLFYSLLLLILLLFYFILEPPLSSYSSSSFGKYVPILFLILLYKYIFFVPLYLIVHLYWSPITFKIICPKRKYLVIIYLGSLCDKGSSFNISNIFSFYLYACYWYWD